MWLKSLFLSNFRNFRRLDIGFCPHLNLFWGDNGEGKTNLLEAIYCLGHGISHRTNSEEELIKWKEEGLYLKGEGSKLERLFTYEFLLSRKNPKVRKVNSHRVNFRDSTKWLWMVTFSPEDVWLVKGGPAQRRKFLDAKLPLFNLRYPYLRFSYRRILFQRNRLLSLAKKDKQVDEHLQSWDKQLVDLGSAIVKLRLEGLEKLESFFKEIYPRVIGRSCKVNLVYGSSFLKNTASSLPIEEIKNAFYKDLALKRAKEMELRITLVGPHRDDFFILVDGINLRSFGSRGEQRIAALSLKLAELDLVKLKEGDYPVSLLDDITSELDPGRQKLLLNLVQSQSQVFLTTTQPSLFESSLLQDARLYQIKANQANQVRK